METGPVSKRGRKLGTIVNPRDKRGWQIPRAGSLRRQVYELLIIGARRAKICSDLGISIPAYRSHHRHITAPIVTNASDYRYKQRAYDLDSPLE
jgi:hypothetical protein